MSFVADITELISEIYRYTQEAKRNPSIFYSLPSATCGLSRCSTRYRTLQTIDSDSNVRKYRGDLSVLCTEKHIIITDFLWRLNRK